MCDEVDFAAMKQRGLNRRQFGAVGALAFLSACTTVGPSSSTLIVRNLSITKSLPLNPFRRCRKITGPGLSSLIAIAVRTKIGASGIKARRHTAISMLRLTTCSAAVRGAR